MRTLEKIKGTHKTILSFGTILFSIHTRAQPLCNAYSLINYNRSCKPISRDCPVTPTAAQAKNYFKLLKTTINEHGYLVGQLLLPIHDPIYLYHTINYNRLKHSTWPAWIIESSCTYKVTPHWQCELGYHYTTHQHGYSLELKYRLFDTLPDRIHYKVLGKKTLSTLQETDLSSPRSNSRIRLSRDHHRAATQQGNYPLLANLTAHPAFCSPRRMASHASNRTGSYMLETRSTEPVYRILPPTQGTTINNALQPRRIPVVPTSANETLLSSSMISPRSLPSAQSIQYVGAIGSIPHQENTRFITRSQSTTDQTSSASPGNSSEIASPRSPGSTQAARYVALTPHQEPTTFIVSSQITTELPSSVPSLHALEINDTAAYGTVDRQNNQLSRSLNILPELQHILPDPNTETYYALPFEQPLIHGASVQSERHIRRENKASTHSTKRTSKTDHRIRKLIKHTCKPINLVQDHLLSSTFIIRGYDTQELKNKSFFLPRFLKKMDTSLPSFKETVPYISENHGNLSNFKIHPDFEAYNAELTQGLQTMLNYLPSYLSLDQKNSLNRRVFQFKENMYNEVFCQGNEYSVLGLMKFYICNIAHLLNNFEQNKNDLGTNCLIACIEHLDICHNGIITYLKNTYDQLLYAKVGFQGLIQKTKEAMIHAGIIEFINKTHHAQLGDLGERRELDLHFLNTYRNQVHEKWGIPKQNDSFQSLCKSISPFHLQECEAYLENLISPSSLAEQLIGIYVQKAEAQWNSASCHEDVMKKVRQLTQLIDEEFPHLSMHDFVLESTEQDRSSFILKPDISLLYAKTIKLLQSKEYIEIEDLDEILASNSSKSIIYLGDYAWIQQSEILSRLQPAELINSNISNLPLSAWAAMFSNLTETSVKDLSHDWIAASKRDINFSNQLIKKSMSLAMCLPILETLALPIPACNEDGELWITKLLEDGRLDLVKKFLADREYQIKQINVRDKKGFTILHWLARYDQYRLIASCLSFENLEYDSVSYEEKYTPLTYAVLHHAYESAQLLLKISKKINQLNSLGDSMLGLLIKSNAAEKHASDIVKLLEEAIEKGLYINGLNNEQLSALHLSILYNQRIIFDFLIAQPKIDINIRAGKLNTSDTPLIYAVRNQSFDILKQLIAAGANLNMKDENGNTPLSLAVVLGLYDFAHLLVNAGSSLNWLSADRSSLLQLAFSQDQISIARLIESKMSHEMLLNLNQYDLSALNAAITSPAADVVDILKLCEHAPDLLTLNQTTDPFESAVQIASAEKFSALQNYVIKHSGHLKHIPHKLLHALKTDRFDEFEDLFNQNTSLDLNTSVDIDQNTILHQIVLMNKPTYLQLCLPWLEKNILVCNKIRQTPLHVAFRMNVSSNLISACLPLFPIDLPDLFGNTALHYVQDGVDSKLLVAILKKEKFDLLQKNQQAVSIFSYLYGYSNAELRELLVNRLIKESDLNCGMTRR